MKNYFFLILIHLTSLGYAQQYQWTGDSNTQDFFDELNWKNILTSETPPPNSINPEVSIDFELLLSCDVVANNEISLGENGKITIVNGELHGELISGIGQINLFESSYIYLESMYPIDESITINFNSHNSWILFRNVNPTTAFYYYNDNFFEENQLLSYPLSLRIDNYYNNGSVIRAQNENSSHLTIFSEFNFNGDSFDITSDYVYTDESIPVNLINNISSFILKRGFMATLAENDDGTGNSKVFIANEKDIIIDSLSEFLNNKISFIRVVPWNWVTKKGTAGDIQYMNNNWFYRWSNTGSSDLEREYSPMAWGKGAADEDSDIEIINNKYKSTHLLAFNEPDNCNDQSGQYGNMCVVDTSLTYYKNLLKSGLRMVSPACRQNQVFSWLVEFNNKAVQQDIRIDAIAVHWYDWNSGPQGSPNADPQQVFNRFVNYLENVYNLFGLPIWITEFNANRHRNEWVHRQFLQLALPYLNETDYVERYSFFPPTNDVADFFDLNENLTEIGEFYNDFNSDKSIDFDRFVSKNNLDDENYNFLETECNPDENFLSNIPVELKDEIIVYPNPTSDFLNIKINEDVRDIKVVNALGELIYNLAPTKRIDVSNLDSGIYFIAINNHTFKFLKK